MLPKLAAFVHHGNKPHQRYMLETVDHANCSVPVIANIRPLVFEDPPGCAAKGDCSIPDY